MEERKKEQDEHNRKKIEYEQKYVE